MADNPNAEHHKKFRKLVDQCEKHPQLHAYVRAIPGKNYQNFENEAFVLASAHSLECINTLNAIDDMENVWDMVILAAEHLLACLEVMEDEAKAKVAEEAAKVTA